MHNFAALVRMVEYEDNLKFAEALVTLDVHGKDVLTDLVKDRVVSNMDFKWLCQLRYYWLVIRTQFNLRGYIHWNLEIVLSHLLA